MIGDEHTSRCSSHWRVYSDRDWQTARGWEETVESEPLYQKPLLASTAVVVLWKQSPMASVLNAIGDASMFKSWRCKDQNQSTVEVHICAFCSSVSFKRCRQKLVSSTTTPLSSDYRLSQSTSHSAFTRCLKSEASFHMFHITNTQVGELKAADIRCPLNTVQTFSNKPSDFLSKRHLRSLHLC